MAHFYGWVRGSRGEATPLGTKGSGYVAVAASWQGRVEVHVWYDRETGKDKFRVSQEMHEGSGVSELLAYGVVGQLVDVKV